MTVTQKLFKILSGHDVANGRTDGRTDGWTLYHNTSEVSLRAYKNLCFDIIYQHTKFELNRCSLLKVIERTPNFDNGRTDARTNAQKNARTNTLTGVTLNAPPPFFEWRGHKNHSRKIILQLSACFIYNTTEDY